LPGGGGLSQENRSLRDQLEAIKKTSGLPSEPSRFELPANLTDEDIIALLATVLKQTPKEKRYSVMFFDHIDRAVKLPQGSAKRLLPKAAEKTIRYRLAHRKQHHAQGTAYQHEFFGRASSRNILIASP